MINAYLQDVDPDDWRFLLVATQIHEKSRRLVIAYQLAKRAVQIAPGKAETWVNMGRLEECLMRFTDSEKCYRKALERVENNAQRIVVLNNLSSCLISAGRFADGCRAARQVLLLDPGYTKAKANLGVGLLAQGQWKEGWPLYDVIIGLGSERKLVQYANEPQWDGSKGKRLAIYGEQGLGDEIVFASMLPDAIRDSFHVVLECDSKLQGLFQRSFPSTKVYGTRWEKTVGWDVADQRLDASISIGGLGKFYRPTPESCPEAPYLVPDPERLSMWKGLFRNVGKPVIGIAWSGGVQWTGAKYRKFDLKDYAQLFGIDAHFVSLQYRDAGEEVAGTKVKQYRYGTLTNDYDDTAAMVAAMDLVIAPPTSVVHLAGGLGVPCIAMKAPYSCWKFAANLPFTRKNMHLVEHDTDWGRTIAKAAAKAKELLC